MVELNLLTVILIKPLVLIVGTLILKPFWRLWAVPGLRIMFWSTIFFLIGELACGIDIYILHRMTFINEGTHDVFMLISFVGYFWALFEILQDKFGCFKPECEAFKNCEIDPRGCSKSQQFGNFPIWLFTTGIISGIFPLFATQVLNQEAMPAGFGETIISSYLYNRTYNLYILQQIVFPLSAIIAFLLNIALYLVSKKMEPLLWKLSFYGLGTLSFVYFRLILINVYHPNIIYTTMGEEILELLFMLLLAAWIFSKYKRISKV